MFRHHLTATGALIGILTLAGCGANNNAPTITDTAGTQNQQENAAESGTNQSGDAATQALLMSATSSGGNGSVSSALDQAALKAPGGWDGINLNALANTVVVVHLAALVDGAGNPLYPNLTGSFTVSSAGAAVSSWPTGTNTQANVTVTVTFDQGPVTYTDPFNGATATITGGSYVYSLESTYNYGGSAKNWTLGVDASTLVASSSPLAWSVTRPHSPTHTVTLYGYRHAHIDFTRAFTLGTTNTLVIARKVDGSPLPGTTTPFGVLGVDGNNPTWYFTNWVHTVDGGSPVIWNRYAAVTVSWNFAPLSRTVSGAVEEIFITRGGVKSPVLTALDLGASTND